MMTDNLVEAMKNGTPVYLEPYKEPKVWGIRGIGEYWYGAEAGAKSSVAVDGDNSAPMAEVLAAATEEVLGEAVLAKFGSSMPLVKILTPFGRLSVQFHDAKNELWVVTGIDESITGGKNELIVGFSPESVEKYGSKVSIKYGEILAAFGKALNGLIDLMEDKGYKDLLAEEKDVYKAAESISGRDNEVGEALARVKMTKEEMESFYDRKEVTIGDVIPIPSGTLHALGSGIEVVEPQIAGPTQSLEDGAIYPVRYYFPGYDRPGAQKKLDIDRVGEMRSEVTLETHPEVIASGEGYTIERLPGDFEDKGLEAHRITMQDGKELTVSDIKSFHSLVAVEGECRVTAGDKEYSIPKASPGGRMLLVPASAGSYKIRASEHSQIIDTFTPV